MAKSSPTNAIHLLLALLLLGGIAFGSPQKHASRSPSKAAAGRKSSKSPGKRAGGKAVAATRKKNTAKPQPALPPVPLAPGELPLAARSAILLDAKTGDVLYEKNPDEIEYPASATKILTAMIIIEAGDLDKMVTIEPEDTRVEPSALEVKPGEQYPRKQLLFALMLKSANDVALALGRDNAGSIEAFAEKMNARAETLGAVSSHFTNPHGLHDPHHFTTSRDLACIARAAMQIPLFREIVSTPKAAMARGDEWLVLKNHNKLLTRLEGCNGVKTGYTRAAQQVLVASATRADQEALSVVMHTNSPGIWEDSKTLLEHGFAKLGAPATTPAATAQAAPVPEPAPAGQGSGSR